METSNVRRGGWKFLDPSTPERGLVLMPRDLSMMRALAENRFMDANQLATLFGEKARPRLRKLAGHGYVTRPKAQRVWRQIEGGGSKPCVYALGNLGARALADAGMAVEKARLDWNEKNNRLASFAQTIPHQLMIVDVRIAFERAVRARGLLLLGGHELAGREVRGLSVPDRDGLLIPDWICGITGDGKETSLFFIEVDRDTEDTAETASNRGRKQSLERKYRSYLSYARSLRQERQFGVRGFRVLTITTGGSVKVANTARVAGKVCEGSGEGRFLVTSMDRLRGADPMEVLWLDAGGKETALAV